MLDRLTSACRDRPLQDRLGLVDAHLLRQNHFPDASLNLWNRAQGVVSLLVFRKQESRVMNSYRFVTVLSKICRLEPRHSLTFVHKMVSLCDTYLVPLGSLHLTAPTLTISWRIISLKPRKIIQRHRANPVVQRQWRTHMKYARCFTLDSQLLEITRAVWFSWLTKVHFFVKIMTTLLVMHWHHDMELMYWWRHIVMFIIVTYFKKCRQILTDAPVKSLHVKMPEQAKLVHLLWKYINMIMMIIVLLFWNELEQNL